MDNLQFMKSIVISNEYVSATNKNAKSKNHGQSKLKINSDSPMFSAAEISDAVEIRSESADNFIFKGKIWFSKKNIDQYFSNIIAIYDTNSENYKNLSKDNLVKYKAKFNSKYSGWEDNICEEYETTNYRYHQQGMKFDLFSDLIFHTAIPYVVKVEFYKFTSDQNSIGCKAGDLYFSVFVDFSLLKNDFFNRKTNEKYRKHQNKYRKSVLDRDTKCLITGIENSCALEACHILPYVLCDEQKKYDINNGLTLTSTIHQLFDEGLITFDHKNGKILLSNLLSTNDINWLKKQINNQIELSKISNIDFKKMSVYLKFHYENIFRNSQ